MAYNPSFPSPGHQPSFPSAPGYPAGHDQTAYVGQTHGHGHGAQPPAPAAGGARGTDTSVNFEGAQFRIEYRDSNSLLSVRLPQDYEVRAKSGSMVAMDASVKIRGKLKVSFKKLLTGGDLSESTFTGPGEVLLAPETWGDIVPINLDGSTPWFFSKHAFLCCTRGITLAHKTQSFGKALFSGEGLFVEQATGQGVLFVASLGAIVRRDLNPGDQWIVDNGHLVSWNAKYAVERIQAGGLFSGAKTDEGLICRFTGPGTVYIQTRNPDVLIDWIKEQLPSSGA